MWYQQEIQKIRERLINYISGHNSVFATSSFQTHSIPMLHIISKIDKNIPIYFLNTGYLFPQTIAYKDLLGELYGLNILEVSSHVPRSMQKDMNGKLLFASDPDHCCDINKVQPMEPLLIKYNVWINGVRADQNENRKRMGEEMATPQGALRYHPMLSWTNIMIWDYIYEMDIPRHPLDAEGYLSIGCEPCTRKFDPEELGDERMARWFGMAKTECGLHTELIK